MRARDKYKCFTKEVLSKLTGVWFVNGFVSKRDANDENEPIREIPDNWKGKKIEINDKEIKWQQLLLNLKTNKKEKISCKLSDIRLNISKHFTNCEDCREDFYSYYKELSPFDLGIYITLGSCILTEDLFSTISHISYLPSKKEIIINVINEGFLFFKKETSMKEIDFSTIENCEDSFWKIGDGEDIKYLNKSYLQKLEGEWEIFKTTNFKYFFYSLSELEARELIGKRINVTKDGFEFLYKSEVYSKYYHDYYCSSKRALIVKNKFSLIKYLAFANNPPFYLNSYDLAFGPLPLYIKTKYGIKEKKIHEERITLYIDNPCQFTIFDTILIFNKKTMVLQMGSDYLYLYKTK